MPWNDPRFAGTWAALYPPTALGGANTPMGPGQDHDADFGTAMAKPEPTYLDMLAAEAAEQPSGAGSAIDRLKESIRAAHEYGASEGQLATATGLDASEIARILTAPDAG